MKRNIAARRIDIEQRMGSDWLRKMLWKAEEGGGEVFDMLVLSATSWKRGTRVVGILR